MSSERACGGGHLRFARALYVYARLLGYPQDNIRAIRLLDRRTGRWLTSSS